MSLAELTVEDLRCLHLGRLELHPQRNLIWGSNGSGKTSLLEAIFILGRGRSFRTRNSERLIRHGKRSLAILGRTEGPTAQTIGIQVSRDGGTLARINGATVASLTELSHAFPVQVIDPGVHKLVEEGGARRRRWMDWAVFHVEHGFADLWARYGRTLKQRNAALRGQPDQVSVWDQALAPLGEQIAESRRELIGRLQPLWAAAVRALSGLEVEMHYMRGWTPDASLLEALHASRLRDQNRGMSLCGPHRADVILRLHGRPAREVLSRGQQKLVAIAMVMSQLRLLQEATGSRATLLIDDPAAELDQPHLVRFIDQVNQLHCQLVLTSLHADAAHFGAPHRVFHVEQGRVETV